MVKFEVFENFDAADGIKDAWNSLISKSSTRTIYQTFEWHKAWWNAFGKGKALKIAAAKDGGEISGIAPFVLSTIRVNGIRERVLSLLGSENYASDYCDFICSKDRPDVLKALLDWTYSNKRLWTLLDLSHLPSESENVTTIKSFCSKFKSIVKPGDKAPTLIFDSPETPLKAASKKSLKRHYNHFNKSGELVFKHFCGKGEMGGYLDAFFEQHINRWRDTRYPSQFLHQRQKDFYHYLVEAFGDTPYLKFGGVFFNGSPIAFHFGFEYRRRFIWYKPSFDISLKKYSPGEVLLKFLLEYAAQSEVDEFDFSVGDEKFKQRFANKTRENSRIVVYKNRAGYLMAKLRSTFNYRVGN